MRAIQDEQLTVHGSAPMGVRVADRLDGETGTVVDTGESSLLPRTPSRTRSSWPGMRTMHAATRPHTDRWDETLGESAGHYATRGEVAEMFGEINASIAEIKVELARLQNRLLLRLGGIVLACLVVAVLVLH